MQDDPRMEEAQLTQIRFTIEIKMCDPTKAISESCVTVAGVDGILLGMAFCCTYAGFGTDNRGKYASGDIICLIQILS